MYRINLYPAGRQKRGARAGRLRRSALLGLLAGLQVLFLGLFVLAAQALSSRADNAVQMTGVMQKRLVEDQRSGNRGPVIEARRLVETKLGRRTWTPVLAEIARLLPDNMMLEKIEAVGGTGSGNFSGLLLAGRLISGQDIAPVVQFTNTLSASPLYRGGYETAKLDRVDTSGEAARFVIACPFAAGKEPGDAARGGAGD